MNRELLENVVEIFARSEGKKRQIPITSNDKPDIPASLKEKWQGSLDVLRAYTGFAVALVVKVTARELTVFQRSAAVEGLYPVGSGCELGRGLYCESVLGTNKPFYIADASRDDVWKDNPDAEQNMFSYYGVPLHWEDGSFFGTLCVLDRHRMLEDEVVRGVFREFARSMDKDLQILDLLEAQKQKIVNTNLALEKLIEGITFGAFDYIGLIYVQEKRFEFVIRGSGIIFPLVRQKTDYDDCRRYVGQNFISDLEKKRFYDLTELSYILQGLEQAEPFSTTYLRTTDKGRSCLQLNYKWLDEDRDKIIVMRTDVTTTYERERRQLLELQQARLEAERANEAKSAFFSTMSHDMRTPLNGIIGFTDIALVENNPAKKQAYLKKIKASGELLLDLINDTLDLSRIESGKMTLQLEETDSREIGEIVVNAMRPAAEVKNIKLLAEIEKFPQKTIWVDKLKVQKVILNLLSNAIKYTLPGGTIWVTIQELNPPREGRNRRIIIKDNGIGMSPEFLPKLFESFSQENRSESVRTVGTGLGMAIVKHIVDLMNGTITVHSTLNQGTEFIVDLPIARVSDGARIHKQQKESIDNLKGKKILLCEGNEINAEIAGHILRNKGMFVELAVNGRLGADLFARSADHEFAAVLMDLEMPVMDGYDAAKAIRSLPRDDAGNVPIIAMTADAFEESIKKAKAVGMDGYIVKPVNPSKLFAKLSACIAGRAG